MDEFEAEWLRLQEDGLKDSPLRREYERKVAALAALPQLLAAEGKTEEQIARIMHETRRALGKEYKLAAPTSMPPRRRGMAIRSARRSICCVRRRATGRSSTRPPGRSGTWTTA